PVRGPQRAVTEPAAQPHRRGAGAGPAAVPQPGAAGVHRPVRAEPAPARGRGGAGGPRRGRSPGGGPLMCPPPAPEHASPAARTPSPQGHFRTAVIVQQLSRGTGFLVTPLAPRGRGVGGEGALASLPLTPGPSPPRGEGRKCQPTLSACLQAE